MSECALAYAVPSLATLLSPRLRIPFHNLFQLHTDKTSVSLHQEHLHPLINHRAVADKEKLGLLQAAAVTLRKSPEPH